MKLRYLIILFLSSCKTAPNIESVDQCLAWEPRLGLNGCRAYLKDPTTKVYPSYEVAK